MDFTTIQTNSTLRSYARQQLQGVWGKMAFAFLVYGAILSPFYLSSIRDLWNDFERWKAYYWSVLDQLDTFELWMSYYENCLSHWDYVVESSAVTNLLMVAVVVTAGAFALGFTGYFLKRIRGEEIVLQNIFDGFKRFGSAFFLTFLTGLFVILWSLLLIIPGIIKALGYSMAFYILYDNPGMSAPEALKKSQIMMKGYRLKLFLLQLSFIGWALLAGIFTLGIGTLWLSPYIGLSMANFYENLKKSQEKPAIEVIATT
jgi:uncharacterized membrane protein